MASISLINISELESTRRIDSEFYKPDYVQASEQLLQCNTIPLRKVAKISDGNHLKIASDFLKSGVRYLRGQDVSTEMLIDDRNEVYISETAYDSLKRSHIFDNDVLITIVGANTGLVGLVYNAPKLLTANCKLGIARPQNINPAYLYAFLTSKYGQFQILRTKRGGGQTGLVLPDMRDLSIARWSKTFENKVADIAFKAHSLVEKSKAVLMDAENLLLAELGLFEWKPKHTRSFVRRYSGATQARRIDSEYFQPKYQEIFDRLKPQVRLAPLGRLTTYKKGIEVGGEAYQEAGVPFWRVSNLSKQGLEIGNANFIKEEVYEALREQYEPRQGELLLSKDATPGLAFYLDSPLKGIISGGILRLILTASIEPHYLELVLNSIFVQLQIEQSAGGSIIKHWKPSEVQQTQIPRLSKEIEKGIANSVKQSHEARREANRLLQLAKRAVEMAVEEDERAALEFIRCRIE